MAWFKGTATDYQDFLNQLKNLAKDDHISAISVYDGGTGYSVGDTITLSGGTKYHEPEIEVRGVSDGDYVSGAAVNAGGSSYAVGDLLYVSGGTYMVQAILEVTTVSGGAVTGVQINNPGIYSAQPSDPVSTTTDGSGTGCTLNLTWTAGTGIITNVHLSDAGVYTAQAANPVSQNTSSGSGTGAKFDLTYTDTAWAAQIDYDAYEATGVAISAAGTGYTAGDIVTVVGGTFTEATTVTIDTVSGGVPQTVSINTAGEYSTTPSNPASTSGGTGSGLTLTMTWTLAADERKFLMLKNANSNQYVGFKGYKVTSPSDAYLIQVAGFTGFNSLSTPWSQQPGSSAATSDTDETLVPLSGGVSPATIYYWISIHDERMVATFKVSSVYPNMYVGKIDPYMTGGEYNYPQLIMGCLARENPYTYGGVDFSGMNNPGADSEIDNGPAFLRDPNGSFKRVINYYESSGNELFADEAVGITPIAHTGEPGLSSPNDWYKSTIDWNLMFKVDGVILSSQLELKRINSEYVLLPCIVVESFLIQRMYGNMRGVFCLNPDTDVTSEDRIFIGNDVYRAFQNCAKSNRNYFFCLKEY